MNELEYLIFIPVKRFIANIAKLNRYFLYGILLTALMEPVLLFVFKLPQGLLLGMVSDQMLNLFVALSSLLAFWCHNTLLAGRGTGFTRFLSGFAIFMSVILVICSIYTICTNELLLTKQSQTPVFVAVILFLSVIINMSNMAAASLKLRITVSVFLFCLMVAVLTTVIPMICLVFKIITACLGIPLLRRLQHVAPLIISMPERN